VKRDSGARAVLLKDGRARKRTENKGKGLLKNHASKEKGGGRSGIKRRPI